MQILFRDSDISEPSLIRLVPRPKVKERQCRRGSRTIPARSSSWQLATFAPAERSRQFCGRSRKVHRTMDQYALWLLIIVGIPALAVAAIYWRMSYVKSD
jgi:hypothetical protein